MDEGPHYENIPLEPIDEILNSHRTISRNVPNVQNTEEFAQKISEKISQNEKLTNTELREILREMPQSLAVKKLVKLKLSKTFTETPPNCWTSLISHLSKLGQIEIWYNSLKKIEGQFGIRVVSYFKFLRFLFILNFLIVVISTSFIVLPHIFYDKNTTNSSPFNPTNIFTGEDYFANSLLFYGHYTNNSINFKDYSYNLPFFYFFTMCFIYLASFLFICLRVATSYRQNFIETESGSRNYYTEKLFTWDFSISNKKTAHLKSIIIHNEIKELINENFLLAKKRGFYLKLRSFLTQIVANLFIVSILCFSSYVIWLLLDKFNRTNNAIITPIFTNLLVIGCLFIFCWIVKFEDYKTPKSELNMNLIRIFLLQMTIISVLVVFWLQKSKEIECWEHFLAKEVYRLIITDFVIFVVLTSFLNLLKKSMEFNTIIFTMQLIYNQSLFWIGLFFSPLLPIVITLKLLVIYYWMGFIIKRKFIPSKKTLKFSQAQNNNFLIIFLVLFSIILMFGLIFYKIPTSKTCGPFRDYEFIYQILTEKLQNNFIWEFLSNFTKPGIVALILVCLSGRVYYLSIKANAQRDLVKVFRNLLNWEAKDKEFLIGLIAKVTNGHLEERFKTETSFRKSNHTRSSSNVSDVYEDFSKYKKFS